MSIVVKKMDFTQTSVLAHGMAVVVVIPSIIHSIKDGKVRVLDQHHALFTVDPSQIMFMPSGLTLNPPIREKISEEPGKKDALVCLCGNGPNTDRFYACDSQGNEVEPSAGRNQLFICADCGRMIDRETLTVVGRNQRPILRG